MSIQLSIDLTDTTPTTQAVWRELQAADEPVTRRELSDRLDRNMTTIHSAIHQLDDRDLLELGYNPTQPTQQIIEAREVR